MSSFTQNLTNFVTRQVESVREMTAPVLRESKFVEKGVLTPDEFVKAGDLLVYKCPTWEWCTADKSKLKSYLPGNKQYLVTRNIPCLSRVNTLVSQKFLEEVVDSGENGEDGWLATHMQGKQEDSGLKKAISIEEAEKNDTNISETMENLNLNTQKEGGDNNSTGNDVKNSATITNNSTTNNVESDDDYADLEGFEDESLLVEDMAMAKEEDEPEYVFAGDMNDNIQLTRRYDIYLTYDKYYQTPRVFLSGSDENGQPLRPEQILEDIMQDYANKTVTIEAFPFTSGGVYASIHPCKHASVMKKIVDHFEDSGRVARVDQYLFIFLKFIQSVIPTMNYDHTMSMEAKT
jgi:ubiquitin-like-conjugating enzyme ATG3